MGDDRLTKTRGAPMPETTPCPPVPGIPSIEPVPGGRIIRSGADVTVQISGSDLARLLWGDKPSE